MNGPIVLLTDFGTQDSFVGIMKGVIRRINPKAEVLDLNHQVPAHNVQRAGFELMTAQAFFPPKSLFVCVVDPGVGSQRKVVLVQSKTHSYLAPDNGLLSWALQADKPVKIVSVENPKFFLHPMSRTFHGRDIFAPVAAHWSKGTAPERFGSKTKTLRLAPFPKPKTIGEKVYGQVLAIDRFGNLTTNLPNALVKDKARGQVSVWIKDIRIKGLSDSYSAARPAEWLFLEGSHGFIEVALRESSAAKALATGEGEPLILVFG